MNATTRTRIWESEHPERAREIHNKAAQKYYYQNREKVLAKKQQKYAEARGQVLVKLDEKTPEVTAPETVPEPEPEMTPFQKWIHPMFSK